MHTENEIILLGGGHTHALVLRKLIERPIPNARVTLISKQIYSPYSGMLPGLIAGHYQYLDNHIDLAKLCAAANVRLVIGEVTQINPNTNTVMVDDIAPFHYDTLSINTGATPRRRMTHSASQSIEVKPIDQFYARWQQLKQHLREATAAPHIAVIGSGAGGVEVVLAMEHACRLDQQIQHKPLFHLIGRAPQILTGYPKSIRNQVTKRLKQRGIQLHTHFEVAHLNEAGLESKNGTVLPIEQVFWCTAVDAPPWTMASGLDCNDKGFINVNAHLQSCSHPNVFACGDIAHMVASPRPKAGVYAVRQAPVLIDNLHRVVSQQPLKQYHAQDDFLSLLALGDQTAVGTRRPVSFQGPWVWRWKDRIDRDFMQQFHALPSPSTSATPNVLTHYHSTAQASPTSLLDGLPCFDDPFLNGKLIGTDWKNRLHHHGRDSAKSTGSIHFYSPCAQHIAERDALVFNTGFNHAFGHALPTSISHSTQHRAIGAFPDTHAQQHRSPAIAAGDEIYALQFFGTTTHIQALREGKGNGRDREHCVKALLTSFESLHDITHNLDDLYGQSLHDWCLTALKHNDIKAITLSLGQLPALLGVQRNIELGVHAISPLASTGIQFDTETADLHPLYPLLFETQVAYFPLLIVKSPEDKTQLEQIKQRGFACGLIAKVQ